jgi:DNA invertase Pin-like site-specific DNA recombinase
VGDTGFRPAVLVELGLVEQRYKAVSEVLVDGATVTEVAQRLGVSRQTVHSWPRRYGNGGIADLADRSSRPARCHFGGDDQHALFSIDAG